MTLRHFDFRIKRLGTNLLLRPLTSQGHLWASDNLPRGERLLPASQRLIPADCVDQTLVALLCAGLTIAPLDE